MTYLFAVACVFFIVATDEAATRGYWGSAGCFSLLALLSGLLALGVI